MLKLNEAFVMLEELTASSNLKEEDKQNSYAIIIECLRRLEMVEKVIGALDTTTELTERFLLEEIQKYVYDDEQVLYDEVEEW